jgi:predicted nucleotidyltransferase
VKLADALGSIQEALTTRGHAFALVGGIAASTHGEARFTRDIDLVVAVVSDAEAEALVYALKTVGYVATTTVEHQATKRLATARLRHENGVVCDLIFATCGIEREIVESAQLTEVFEGRSVRTATVEALLAMKVLAATDQRPRDAGDIRAMVLANPNFDEALLRTYLKQIEARGYARDQKLEPKWDTLRMKLGV